MTGNGIDKVLNGQTEGGFDSVNEESAFNLSKAAIQLDQARQNLTDKGRLAAALDNNLELWVAIRTIVDRAESPLPEETRKMLIRLSQFVADMTFAKGVDIEDESVNTLININLQIAEGLLEGDRARH